jgi:hypothetical protein
MSTGRTVTKWMRFICDDNAGAPHEIPIDTMSPVGFVFDSTDLTAYQDAVKGYLAGHPDAPIDITGPFSTTALTTVAASAAAPTLSGSHTLLILISTPTFSTPLGLCVCFGVQGYWTAATDPVFGVIAPSATSGYVCTGYTVSGEKYAASFKPFPGTIPAWGTAILT